MILNDIPKTAMDFVMQTKPKHLSPQAYIIAVLVQAAQQHDQNHEGVNNERNEDGTN